MHKSVAFEQMMKRPFAPILAALAAAAIFAGFVHAVLVPRTFPSQRPPWFTA